MRKAAIGLALLGVLLVAVPAGAQSSEIRIELEGVVRGPTGSVQLWPGLGPVDVDVSLVGATCTGTASTFNEVNPSEHPNNDFIIASGADSAEILDFEAVAFRTTTMVGTLTLGESITVSIRLGGDGVSSGGFAIVLTCAQQPPPTTTQPPVTTTQPPVTTTQPSVTTTQPSVTTTQPPGVTTTQAPGATTTQPGDPGTPVGGVEAGGGSAAAAGNSVGVAVVGVGVLVLIGAAALSVQALRLASRRE